MARFKKHVKAWSVVILVRRFVFVLLINLLQPEVHMPCLTLSYITNTPFDKIGIVAGLWLHMLAWFLQRYIQPFFRHNSNSLELISLSFLVIIGLFVGGAQRLHDAFGKHALNNINMINSILQWFHCWLS